MSRSGDRRKPVPSMHGAAITQAKHVACIKCNVTRAYHQIVVLSDLHFPGNNLPAKEKALRTIASWDDVDMIAVTGDIVSRDGTPEEYAAARNFLGTLNRPLRVTGGNHDYIYPDGCPPNPATGHTLKQACPQKRKLKLERFKKTWNLQTLSYSEMLGAYLLVFLTPDHLTSNNYAEMTNQSLAWFARVLEQNQAAPTLVFFHAPLQGTYKSEKIAKATTPDSYNAEPARQIREILLKNRQVLLWLAGHLHLAPSSRSFASPINVYENRVRVIHNADWNGESIFSEEATQATRHDSIWTNSLFLHPDRVVVRTFDHKQGRWLAELERTISVP